MEIRIARGLGGKGFVILTGEVSAVRSAVKAAMNQLEETGGYYKQQRDRIAPSGID